MIIYSWIPWNKTALRFRAHPVVSSSYHLIISGKHLITVLTIMEEDVVKGVHSGTYGENCPLFRTSGNWYAPRLPKLQGVISLWSPGSFPWEILALGHMCKDTYRGEAEWTRMIQVVWWSQKVRHSLSFSGWGHSAWRNVSRSWSRKCTGFPRIRSSSLKLLEIVFLLLVMTRSCTLTC